MIANVEAENMILSAMMQSADIIDRLSDILTPECFFDPLLGRMFRAARDLHFAGQASGAVAINGIFAQDEAYKQAGGAALMASLTSSSGALVGAVSLANQVASLARRRNMVEGLNAAVALASDQAAPLAEAVELADTAMSDATQQSDGIEHKTAVGCVDAMLEQLESMDQGVMCKAIPPMDELMGGARRKQMIILAARPGMGKTAVAISYSIGAAKNGHGVLYISLEMSGAELGARMAADACFDGERGVPYGAIVNQNVTRNDLRKIQEARRVINDLPLHVVDASSLSVHRLNVMVRRYVRRFAAKGQRLDMVVVDYLQLLSADKGKSAYEAVSQISRALKAIAKEHDVAVLALAQLSREVEKRPGCRPQLSDLRDSGQIEQDADTVMFLLRNEYYLQRERPAEHSVEHLQWEQQMEQHRGQIEFICAKRRNGETGQKIGAFHGAFQAVRGL